MPFSMCSSRVVGAHDFCARVSLGVFQFFACVLLLCATGATIAATASVRITQGQFESSRDKSAFELAMSEAMGRTFKIENPAVDDQESRWFGYSVALNGDLCVVGAPYASPQAGRDAGAAYVFMRSNGRWLQQAQLVGSDTAADDQFGYSVALSGDTIAVGAYQADTTQGVDAGAAYVFIRNGNVWTEQAKLTSTDGSLGEEFGGSVAVQNHTVIVGAENDNNASGQSSGAAYVFTRTGSTWTSQAKLTAPGRPAGEDFGAAVAISGETVIVGAPLSNASAGPFSGAAYVFTRSGVNWTQQSKLTAGAAGSQAANFGSAVHINFDSAIIGAPNESNSNGMGAGAAYLFQRNAGSWTLRSKMLASDGAEFDEFGSAVAISGTVAAVGAKNDRPASGERDGAVYLFSPGPETWVQTSKLLPMPADRAGQFGTSVSLDGNSLVVGAFADRTFGGSVALFDFGVEGWALVDHIQAIESRSSDGFGASVAIAGGTAIVGAPTDDTTTGGSDAGSAFIFDRNGDEWIFRQRLIPYDGLAGDQFGRSVSISGNFAVIGAPGANTTSGSDSGAAYVYERDWGNWYMEEKLTAADGASGDRFGTAVAVSDFHLVVGAPKDDTSAGIDAGSAYVFSRDGLGAWLQQIRLNHSDAAPSDQFGNAVAMSGDLALVGAFNADLPGASNAGAAYVFQGSGSNWLQDAKLFASDAQAEKLFGAAVAISSSSAIVGAPESDTVPVSQGGAAYLFSRPNDFWVQDLRITAEDISPGDQFGAAVAIYGDRAIVGAPADDTEAGIDSGSARVFERSGLLWAPAGQLSAHDAGPGDRFGSSAALWGDFPLLGAPLDDDLLGIPDHGSAYVRVLGFADGFE